MLPRLLSTLSVLAVISFGVGVGPALAVEIVFGSLNPSPGGCTTTAGDDGFVCANTQSFVGGTFTATGFSDAFLTATALTFKPLLLNPSIGPPFNSFAESGLGENAAGPPSACTDSASPTDCEIAGTSAVAIVSSDAPITDIIIGSVQNTDNFRVFAGDSIATLLDITGLLDETTCTAGPVDDTCIVTGFSALVVGVQSGGIGNVLLTAVSQPQVPEPATLVLLGAGLLGLGLVRRRFA